MGSAETAGEYAGKGLGGWIGGALGSFVFPPLGTLAGRWVGSKLGGMAGRAAAGALSAAMQGANEDAQPADQAEEDTETCATCCTAECKKLEEDINRRMYGNKRRPGEGGQPAGGYHGQFPRRAEQICGAGGPGTPSWTEHARILDQQKDELKRLYDRYLKAGCLGHPDESINWGDFAWATGPSFNPSPSDWLGPNNAQCQTAKDMIRRNQAREAVDLLRRFPRPTGPIIY
jgi:hypothetical protein